MARHLNLQSEFTVYWSAFHGAIYARTMELVTARVTLGHVAAPPVSRGYDCSGYVDKVRTRLRAINPPQVFAVPAPPPPSRAQEGPTGPGRGAKPPHAQPAPAAQATPAAPLATRLNINDLRLAADNVHPGISTLVGAMADGSTAEFCLNHLLYQTCKLSPCLRSHAHPSSGKTPKTGPSHPGSGRGGKAAK